MRITHEASFHEENSFLTLTYSDNNIPPHGSLRYDDLTRFVQRLKIDLKRKTGTVIKYYAVGEYGDRSLRPHYHACLFGHAFLDQRIVVATTPHLLWTNPYLERIWGLGQVRVGALDFATARYTASYITKKLRAKQKYVRTDEQTGELIAVEQPKAFMSRNIGKDWWNQWGHQLKDHDHVVINGQRGKPPKAYDRWLGEVDEQELERIKNQRIAAAPSVTDQQRHARARNAHARVKQKSKSV